MRYAAPLRPGGCDARVHGWQRFLNEPGRIIGYWSNPQVDPGDCHGAQVFRHRRHSRPRQRQDHRRSGDEGRPGGRPAVPARRLSPPSRHRQGHPPLRLHDRIRDGRRLHLGRHGRAAARPDADAGGGDADPVDALRPRRDDLRLPQSLRRQRHQAVRARRVQAVGRDRGEHRGADRRRPRRPARQIAAARPRQAHRRRRRALHRIRQADAAARRFLRRPAGGHRLRQRRRLQGRARGAVGARRGSDQDRRRAGRRQHQPGRRLDRARRRWRRRSGRCAPTSASRSTATPTA